MNAESEVHAFLDDFDQAFAAGDADALADLFADDGLLLLLNREPLQGRTAIRDHWAPFFTKMGTRERGRRSIGWVEAEGIGPTPLSIYSETLVHRAGTEPSRVVRGRVVYFLHRDPDGAWRITLAMNSHSRPTEEER
jgi:uncharacterized protein (TIGR02246 family)